MGETIDVGDTKQHLSRLLARVEAGEQFVRSFTRARLPGTTGDDRASIRRDVDVTS